MLRQLNSNFEKMPLTISICSGKGGVGKSVICSNLGYSLSKMGFKTIIWDADSFFPNQHLLFGVEPPIRLLDVYKNQVPIINAISNISKNLDLLSDSPATGNFVRSGVTPILDVYKDLLMDTEYDIILFDTPAGASEQLIQCSKISDNIIIMITDEPTSLIDAYGLIKIILKFVKKEKLSLLVNNVIDIEDADEVSHKLSSATIKFLGFELHQLGFVPYDRLVRLSIQKQELFTISNPDIEISNYIDKIAKNIAQLKVKK
ncbi:MAG TPA: P-loop NTPase [Candidatus Kapabacteria bacterium]|nr:P-loop NTPase [Candidatus Kapabacteria bacterium]